MRKIRAIIGTVLSVLMLVTCSMAQPVFATGDDESELEELQKQESEVEQKETETQEQLEEAQKKVKKVQKAVKELDGKISEVEAAILQLDADIEENLALLEKTKSELETAQETEAIWYEKLKLRLKAVYESGQTTYLEVLLQAENMSELFSKAEYSKDLASYDRDIMENLGLARAEVEAKEKEVSEEEAALEESRAQQEEKKAELQEIKEEKSKELDSLKEDAETLAVYVEELQAEREALSAEIAETAARIEAERKAAEEAARKAAEEEAKRKAAEEEAARKAAEEEAAREAAEAQQQEEEPEAEDEPEESYYEEEEDTSDDYEDTGSYSGGGLYWPVPGYAHLTTYFGEADAIYGLPHRGIDVAAPGGTPIVAAESGTVITAGWNGSYGNYIAISHGAGVVTLYAHCSALYVSYGDYVSAGQTIAAVGTTGDSTGNHLHFEVQVNGGLANPLSYTSP